MALIIKDRIKEVTTTTGTGTITLAGASTGFRSFADIGNANTTYYCISGGSQFEVGLGTYTASGTTLSRDTVLSNSLGTTALINFSAGTKDVFCTYPSGKAILGDTSSVASTGTGSVVLSTNPTFATDITVNGLKVGRGDGNIATNTAYGFDAIGSSYIVSGNTNNVGIGYNSLNNIGAGVATVTQLTAGSGYDSGYDGSGAALVYVSGTPIIAGGTAPTAFVNINGDGTINSVSISSIGHGWTALDTVFTLNNADLGGVGSGATFRIASLAPAVNNTAIGYNAGSTQKVGSNSVHVGYNTTGTGSNQVLLGSNVNATADNVVIIGDTNITNTTLRGNVTATTFTGTGVFTALSANGSLQLTGSLTGTHNLATSQTSGTLTIGGATATGAITLGRSTSSQTVNIATGANTTGTKTLNLGNNGGAGGTTAIAIGSNAGTSTTALNGSVSIPVDIYALNIGNVQSTGAIGIGGPSATGTITLGQSTGAQTVNIATGVNTSNTKAVNIGTGGISTSVTNVTIGTTGAGTSTTTIGGGTGTQTINIGAGNTGSGITKTVNISTSGNSSSTNTVNIGTATTNINLIGRVSVGSTLSQTTNTVENILVIGTAVGQRGFVTDYLITPVFNADISISGGGGTNKTPVFYDGTTWRVG